MWRFAPIFLLACGLGALACTPQSGSSSAPPPEPPGEPETRGEEAARRADLAIEVATAAVRRGAILEKVSAPGSLRARRESRIGAEVSGRIQQVFVGDGDRVEAGDPLFQIDREPYEMALRQAAAGLDLARAERAQIEADLARANELSRSDILAAQQLERLRTQVAVAKARERQAAEGVALARHHLEQTRIVAPFGGSVAQRLVDEGTTALVQPQTIVIVLQETSLLEAEANVPESQRSAVHVGDAVQIHVEGLPQPIETTVSAVSDTIDPQARTYRVQMLVPNPDHALKAGIFGRVDILPRAKRDVVLVPRAAVRSEEGSTRVLVVRDGRAVAIPVQLGVVTEEDAEVLAGLAVDDQVIVGGAAREIAPGMPVRVVAAPGSPAS
jgi:membrane fusion protein (multidrug efflux system)